MKALPVKLSRGEDVSDFLPPPDIILLADVIYYEEVCMCVHVYVSPTCIPILLNRH